MTGSSCCATTFGGRLRDAARTLSVDAVWNDLADFVHRALFADPADPRLVFEDNGMVLVAARWSTPRSMTRRSRPCFATRSWTGLGGPRGGARQDRARREREAQAVERHKAEAQAETARFHAALETERVERELALVRVRVDADLKAVEKRAEEQAAKDALEDARQKNALARKERSATLDESIARGQVDVVSARLQAEARAAVARFEAAQGPLSEAILALGHQEVLAKVAEAVSAQRLLGGKDVADVVSRLFEGTALQDVFARIERNAGSPSPTNG